MSEETTICDGCGTVPLSHLSLDLAEPLGAWSAALEAAGVEVVVDDLGRDSITRADLGRLLAERRDREAEQAARRRHPERPQVPTPAGVPALAGASALESMRAGQHVVLPSEEFGGGRVPPTRDLLDAQLAEGRKAQDEKRRQNAERAEAAKRKAERQKKLANVDRMIGQLSGKGKEK